MTETDCPYQKLDLLVEPAGRWFLPKLDLLSKAPQALGGDAVLVGTATIAPHDATLLLSLRDSSGKEVDSMNYYEELEPGFEGTFLPSKTQPLISIIFPRPRGDCHLSQESERNNLPFSSRARVSLRSVNLNAKKSNFDSMLAGIETATIIQLCGFGSTLCSEVPHASK